jgi:uncharacterized membrane protein (DUF4010 family)
VISALISPFFLTLGVSFLIGIGLREYYEGEKKFDTFGTVRTFVFVGMLGFILFQLPEIGREAYLYGLLSLALFLALYYANKLQEKKSPGLIGVLIALLTYAIGPIVLTQPAWFPLLIAISVLIVLHSKGRIREFTDRLETGEVVTACKFIAMAGVVLPLMPERSDVLSGLAGRIFAELPVTPRQIWLAVVITTAISYLGYVLHTYLFPKRGLLLTGIVGGVYSSTAAVLVIARKAKLAPEMAEEAAVAIVMAVSMMYFRLLVLVAIFRVQALAVVGPALLALSALAAGYALWLHRRRGPESSPSAGGPEAEVALHQNPLELNAALLFATLFTVMAWATRYALRNYQDTGLRAMSFAVGFSDITPFVVSILQGNLGLGDAQIVQAVIIASASNNLLKTAYTWAAGPRCTALLAAPALLALALISGLYARFGL